MLYADRRNAQNGSDASSWQAAVRLHWFWRTTQKITRSNLPGLELCQRLGQLCRRSGRMQPSPRGSNGFNIKIPFPGYLETNNTFVTTDCENLITAAIGIAGWT
jgi:hypothetical protein